LPGAMRRLVMEHEKEWLDARAMRDEVDAQIGDDVGDVTPGERGFRRRRVELRTVIDSLPRHNLPAIEPHRIAAEVPFPDHAGIVAAALEQTHHRRARA